LYYVSKLARDNGTIVVQVGEGADEIFSGYEKYVTNVRLYENVWRHAAAAPGFLKKLAGGSLKAATELTGKKRSIAELGRRLASDEPMFQGGVVVYDETTKPKVLSPRMKASRNGHSSVTAVTKYLDAIAANDLVFGIGVAGTGKSFLAVAMAVDALFKKQVSRIILTRPAVEAGERLGFLPGDLQDKVDPYLRPLYDALFDLVDAEKVTKMLEKRIIEIAPLAFMRGRTLSDAFIILDEAQNTTSEQMKMFLTRIGFGSKAVVTGDKTQIDLPRGQRSGLKEAEHVLANIDAIEFVYFSEKDVVRHKLVQMIVKAYEEHGNDRPPHPDQER
jgi:phosphate starvation-inducible PhoH-like protein